MWFREKSYGEVLEDEAGIDQNEDQDIKANLHMKMYEED